MSNSIKFFGRDYTRIDEDLDLAIINFEFELNNEQKKRILVMFLKEIQSESKKLIVNSKSDTSYNLFTQIREDYYFDGLVGVISSKINILKKDIFDDKEYLDEKVEIDVELQIQSRFDISSNKKGGQPFFLVTMLMEWLNVKLNKESVLSNLNENLYEFLLLFIFIQNLEDAKIKGVFRIYHTFEKNDDKIKGTIDVSRQIKENLGLNNGKIAYLYRENNIDNYFNYLIIKTYEFLKKKYFNLVVSIFDSKQELKSFINNLNYNINHKIYDTKTIIFKNLNPISHPFYIKYETLRKTCLKILRNEGVSFFDDNNDNYIKGILFYIPDLWEKYLENLLKNSDYFLVSQNKIKVFDYKNTCEFKQETIPDFVFVDKCSSSPFMILDAKFKASWSEAIFNESSFSNVLDDYDKCIRDMNSINGHATGAIFPTNDERAKNSKDYIEHNISKYNKMDKFFTFPIFVPFVHDNYEEWYNEFYKESEKMTHLIKENVLNEREFYNNINGLVDNINKKRK